MEGPDPDDSNRMDEAAAALFEVRTGHVPIHELPMPLRPRTLGEAYDVQERLSARLQSAGFGAEVGFKIGCTTAVMQAYLEVDHPCAGTLLANTVQFERGRFPRSDLCRPGVECEIAVEIGEDILTDVDLDASSVASYVRAARASIELVDDRWTRFAEVSTPTLVADHFFNAGCVLGAPAHVAPETLDAVEGAMSINGVSVGTGKGEDILGHPLAALAWLANHRRLRGAPLRAGQLVSLGSMVKTSWIEAGDTVEIEVSGLGGCSLRIE